jgi:hypothetical protein
MAMDPTIEKFRLGISGQVGEYGVVTLEDTLSVLRGDEEVARRPVPGLGAFITEAKDLKLGWGRFPDGMEVVYLYDRGDDHFGYAANLQDEDCSEWGYAPFR